jgi:hypothetical protein
MFSYAMSVASSASSSLKSQSRALASSIYPRISVLGCLGIPAALLLLSFATAAWILVFFLLPPLLICVWMALQPWRLWLFLKSRMIGNRFSG